MSEKEAIFVDLKETVNRSIDRVFDAVVDPDELKGYFVSASSGHLEPGKVIKWEFADYGVNLEIDVLMVKQDRLIEFEWDAGGKRAVVRMEFERTDDAICTLRIKEGPFELNKIEVDMALEQTHGWTDFICCLKAYLYTGINLRTAG